MQPKQSKKAEFSPQQEDLELLNLSEEALDSFLKEEEATFACMKFFQKQNMLESPSDFAMSLELEAFNSENSAMLPLPKYLQNYMDMSFEVPKSKHNNSFVVKVAKEGIRLLSEVLESSFHVLPQLEVAVRSKEVESTQTIQLEEKQESYQIQYQIIKENENEVYLSIHFPKNHKSPYEQVILRKNNRFIYSSQIGESGIVSFSGLQEGRYVVEFLGKKVSKSIDITILLDHP
ncbi:MAG: hypothetical protein QXO70_04115 [Candidatus Pacearchaeota archaeon]